MPAQSVDSIFLTDNLTPRSAADSKGNIVTIQETGQTGVLGVYTVYRYDSRGRWLETLTSPITASGRIVFLTLDAADNIYAGFYDADGNGTVVRPGDPLGQSPWTISGPMQLQALAFDPQGNPVLLSSDKDTGRMQVTKFDRNSAQVLASYWFASSWDYPAAIATDRAGAVYIAGSTSSPDFPVTAGAWPAGCAVIGRNGSYACNEAFAIKLDPNLQSVIYAGLLAPGGASSLAVAPDGTAYVAGPRFPFYPNPAFVVKVDSQGSVAASTTALSGVAELHLDPAGSVIALGGTTSGSACGPDRTKVNGSIPAVFVTRMDAALAKVSGSALIPQQDFLGPAAMLADGSLYLPATPPAGAQVFSAVSSNGVRMLHVNLDAPAPPVTCIINGANFLAENAVAPGQLVTILGRGLGPETGVVFDAGRQLPFAAEGTEVEIGGLPAPILYVTSRQINVVAPFGITPGAQAPLVVKRNGTPIYTWTMDVVDANPTPLLALGPNGLIPDDQTVPVVPLVSAANEDGSPNSRQNPARTGSLVTFFATGYGRLLPAADGAPVASPTVVENPGSIASRAGTLQLVRISTIPGWSNGVVAVTFRVPDTRLPGIADLVFRLVSSLNNQNPAMAFLYTAQ